MFDYATSMKAEKFEFSVDGVDYIFWAWKGDYLNLGAGAEMGIYTRLPNTNHWLVDQSLALPMTLKLVDSNGTTIFDYQPTENQWWVTGFNPSYQNVLACELTATYTIDFTGRTKMFENFKFSIDPSDKRWEFDTLNKLATFVF